jgi:hypothetical protein
MDGDPRIAEHATPLEGVVATFTEIDKANRSTRTRAAGAETREQETLRLTESSIDLYFGSIDLPFCSLLDFVSTVFRIKRNSAIPDMTKRNYRYFKYFGSMLHFRYHFGVRVSNAVIWRQVPHG